MLCICVYVYIYIYIYIHIHIICMYIYIYILLIHPPSFEEGEERGAARFAEVPRDLRERAPDTAYTRCYMA